jgi:hypothetical protein
MKELPEKLNPKNITHFKEYQQTRDLCYLRRNIYEFLLHTDFDRDYFDTTFFFQQQKITDIDIKKKMLQQIIEELKRLKWHVGMVFDQTALLVYPTRQELETCFWSTSLDFKCL